MEEKTYSATHHPYNSTLNSLLQACFMMKSFVLRLQLPPSPSWNKTAAFVRLPTLDADCSKSFSATLLSVPAWAKIHHPQQQGKGVTLDERGLHSNFSKQGLLCCLEHHPSLSPPPCSPTWKLPTMTKPAALVQPVISAVVFTQEL